MLPPLHAETAGVLFFDRMTGFETLTYMDEFRRYWAKDEDEEKDEPEA